MKSEDILKAIGNIDEKYISQADKEKGTVMRLVKPLAVIAACVCLVAGGIGAYRHFSYKNLPQLGSYNIVFDSMGFDGTNSYSLKNSDDINPWNGQTKIRTLPVYKNLCYSGGSLTQSHYSAQELETMANQVAEFFGETVISTQITTADDDENQIYALIAQTESLQISVNGRGASVIFKSEQFSDEKTVGLFSELEKNAESFDSTGYVSGNAATISDSGEWLGNKLIAYKLGKNTVENIVNFNLRPVEVSFSKDGNVYSVHFEDYTSCSEKLGDYPIISADDAKAMLLNGKYLTSVDEENLISCGKVTEKLIEKVDLVYYTTGNPELYMPYYRFFVRLDLLEQRTESVDADFESYGYFYVPAVNEKCFENYELFDGSFQ